MKKIIVFGLCGALAACSGDDSTSNTSVPDISSIYDGVYTTDNGDSLFYSKKEEVAFVFSPPVRDDLGTPSDSNRLISFKSLVTNQHFLKTNELAKVDAGNSSLLYSDTDVDIELSENEVNVISMKGIDPDFGNEIVFYENKQFTKIINNQYINLSDGVYGDFYNTDISITDNQTKLETIYDSERDLLCSVTAYLVKSKYYYQVTKSTISCDDASHSMNGDYTGVVYAANDRAIVALTKADLSQNFRKSFTLN
ncbi:TPA: hypothetical protein NGS68_000527 [Vibrio parahaemolyticus]|nr:hypothetical protein [Vibrio parahaemolyticus]HCG6655981.1 hypothetical protein [Vibrio parahaemolyticus]HCG6660049.1 hypothetical protein [Vibrio parahaemolyticus]